MAERGCEFQGRPISPSPEDCCGSGCTPCVLDIYEQELRLWKLSLNQIKPCTPIRFALSTDSYLNCVISAMESITHGVILYTISFLDKDLICNLFPGSHIILQASSKDNTHTITRQYTPISSLTSVGSLDLIIKVYCDGRMSALVREWSIGSVVRIRGPFGSFDIKQNQYKYMSMLACGTGIAPMYQVMRQMLENESEETRIILLYSVSTAKDILLKQQLDNFAQYWNVKIIYFLTKENNEKKIPLKYKDLVFYKRIDREIIEKELPSSSYHKVLICGTKYFNQDMKNMLIDSLGFSDNQLKIF